MFAATRSDPRGEELEPQPDHKAAEHNASRVLNSLSSEALKDYLQANRSRYEAVSRRSGFGITYGEKTCFDHDSQQVVIGVAQLEKLGITDPQSVDFIVLHELGHFKELQDDTDGYLSVIAEAQRDDGRGKAYFGFYNALMDIYVNTNTRNQAPLYEVEKVEEKGERHFSQPIESLYREQLFKNRDMTELPLSTQYSHALLNIGMGTGDDLILSPEVEKAIEAPIHLLGKEFSTAELIDTFLRPAIGVRRSSQWQATVSQRKQIIDQTFRPIFEQLVSDDVENERKLVPGDPLGDMEVSPEDLQEAAKTIKQQKAEEAKNPEERVEDERKDQARKVGEGNGLSTAEAQNFAEKLSEVQPVVSELVKLFRSIRFPTTEWKREERGHFKSGTILDVQQAIHDFPVISERPDDARVMKRREYQELKVEHPKKIRLWLVPDLSGSMASDEALLQSITMAFAAALSTLSESERLAQGTLGGALGVKGFHGSAVDVVPMKDDVNLNEIARGWKSMRADGSNTADHTALEEIVSEVHALPQDEDSIKLLIEITDGATEDPARSAAAVRSLRELGITPFAYQVSRSGDEASAFDQVWNSDGHRDGTFVYSTEAVLDDIRKRLTKWIHQQ